MRNLKEVILTGIDTASTKAKSFFALAPVFVMLLSSCQLDDGSINTEPKLTITTSIPNGLEDNIPDNDLTPVPVEVPEPIDMRPTE